MLERRIEEASLNSWRTPQQMLFDGWVIRFARAYTKRTSSVTPVYPSLLPIAEKIAFCEQYYHEHGLPTIFRLPSFSAEAHILEDTLIQRDYQRIDLTLVLSTPLVPLQISQDLAMLAVSLQEWLPIYSQFSQVSEERQASHRAILQQIVHQPLFALYTMHDVPVACGLGVLEHELFGLFDIVTHPAHRNQGYGTALVSGMLDWARVEGANRAYLQVVSTNQQALRLYAKFGFQEIYHYWYRVQTMK